MRFVVTALALLPIFSFAQLLPDEKTCNQEANAKGLMGNVHILYVKHCMNRTSSSGSDPVTPSHITVAQDRFTGEMKFSTEFKPHLDGRLHPQIILTLDKDAKFKSAAFLLTGGFHGWKYLRCNETHWLIDGKPVELQKAVHHGDVANGGYVVETMIQPLDASQLKSMNAVKSVEYKVCNDEYAFDQDDLSGLLEIANKLQ